jgi:predicted RND superfamily exporter protein
MMPIVKIVTGYPKAIFAATLLLVAACIPSLLQIRADTSISSFLPRGHVSYEQKLEIQRVYNINDPLFVDVFDKRTGDIFTPEGLKAVRSVSRFMEELKGIRPGSVRSLDTFDDIRGSAGGFDVAPFLKTMPSSAEAARAVRDRVKAFPLNDGLIVSRDGKRAGVVADFEESADVLLVFAELEQLRERMEGEGDISIKVSGPPIVRGTLNVYLNQDALTLDPVAALLTSLLLFLALRSLSGVLLPLSVMLPAIAAAFAAMPRLGFDFTPFSNAIPVVILATSIADSVHFLSGYFDLRLRRPELGAKVAATLTFAETWQPIVMTSVTTAAGFLMLIQGSPMLPVQQFGVTVAIGVLAAMVLSLTALPAAIVLFDAKPSTAFARLYAARGAGDPSGWDRLVGWSMGGVIDNRKVASGFLLGIAVLGITGMSLLYADYEPVTFFPKDSNVYQDFHSIRGDYLGLSLVEVDIDTGVDDGVYAPYFLKRLDKLQNRIESWPQVGGTMSLADYLKKMNQAFNADKPDFYRISDNADANAQFFLLYNLSGDPRRFDEVTDSGRRRANLRIFLKDGNYAQNGTFIRWLKEEAAATFQDAKVTLGGETNVLHHWMSGIGKDVGWSVFLSGLVMYLIGAAFLRSLVGGLLMLAPIGAGLILTYAFIGASGVPVGLGTSSFASIAMGVGVDFAIHYLWRYRDERRQGLEHAAATRRVMEDVGKAILFNGIIVVGGFSVLILATTTPPQQVGAYVAISVAASLATTFLVLSVATRWWNVMPEKNPTAEVENA